MMFIYQCYKYMYHVYYIHMLSKNICGNFQHNACYSKAGGISTIRDCTKRISTNFNLEVPSRHFGKRRNLSIERCNVKIMHEHLNSVLEFYSHFSDNNRHNISTVHAHIFFML